MCHGRIQRNIVLCGISQAVSRKIYVSDKLHLELQATDLLKMFNQLPPFGGKVIFLITALYVSAAGLQPAAVCGGLMFPQAAGVGMIRTRTATRPATAGAI